MPGKFARERNSQLGCQVKGIMNGVKKEQNKRPFSSSFYRSIISELVFVASDRSAISLYIVE